DSLTACAPAELFFRNTTEGANRYFWDFGDGTTSTDVNGQHSYANPGAYDVKLIAFFDDVCVDSFELFRPLRVLRSPMASFFFQERMTTEPSGIFEFINTSRNASSFLWDFGDGNTSESNNAIHRYFTNGPKEVSLTAFGANGCTDDTVQIIDPAFLGYLYVPNALSPDLGTGDSRIFLPKGVGLKDYHLKIYAANGELIWETTLLTDGQPAEGWDGTKEGNPLPQDTYIWEIDAVFENDRSWQGVEKPNGRFQNVGTLLLLR
ncbi:MAG: PKD domain-containing protein, partial [Bacteroidota bacterium]